MKKFLNSFLIFLREVFGKEEHLVFESYIPDDETQAEHLRFQLGFRLKKPRKFKNLDVKIKILDIDENNPKSIPISYEVNKILTEKEAEELNIILSQIINHLLKKGKE